MLHDFLEKNIINKLSNRGFLVNEINNSFNIQQNSEESDICCKSRKNEIEYTKCYFNSPPDVVAITINYNYIKGVIITFLCKML